MEIKNPTAPCICCYTTSWNINSAKQAVNDKLQGSVAAYLRCGGVVNKQIKKGLLLSLWVHFLRLLAVCWPGAQSAWDKHALCQISTDLQKNSLRRNSSSVYRS